jgi:hypothetical protein
MLLLLHLPASTLALRAIHILTADWLPASSKHRQYC